jgi:hypothetical protein
LAAGQKLELRQIAAKMLTKFVSDITPRRFRSLELLAVNWPQQSSLLKTRGLSVLAGLLWEVLDGSQNAIE